MTRDEELMNEIIQRRGYMVISANRQLRIGEVLDEPVSSLDTKSQWYVISVSDRSDMDEQTKMAMELHKGVCPIAIRGRYFYRVVSD
jgi:hypothetical protein